MLLAVGASMAVLILWQRVMLSLYPPQPKAAISAVSSQPDLAIAPATQPTQWSGESAAAPSASTTSGAVAGLVAQPATGPDRIELGRDQPAKGGDPAAYWLYLALSAEGGGVETASVTPFRNEVARGRNPPPDTYDLVQPWSEPETNILHRAFGTTLLRLTDAKQEIDLGKLKWSGRKESDGSTEKAIFETEVALDGKPLLRVRKTYLLTPGSFDVALRLDVENLTDRPTPITLTQQGAIGLRVEDSRGHDHFVLSGIREGQNVHAKTVDRNTVIKAEHRHYDLVPKEGELLWIAQTNKWFTSVVRPLPPAADPSAPLKMVKATATTWTAASGQETDLRTVLVFRPEAGVPAHGAARVDLDLYLGPKDRTLFEHGAQFAGLGYDAIVDATSQSCAILTFRPLTAMMRWLLYSLNRAFSSVFGGQNYGWAIITMVVLVRIMLHGLTKRGQISMMRTQKKMAKLQPKMASLRLKHSSDPQALNREMMELYRAEGVSPFATMSGCLPMFIQMPIWVALWSTLNSTIELRHAPFILWMRDLASPDAAIHFAQAVHIPLLGSMLGPIHGLNLLPIFMTITMVAQQKLTQKLTKPDAPAEPTAAPTDGGPTPEEQMRQQQQIMMFSTVFFGLLLYNSPCGLNIYIWTSSLLAMVEQWRIRKHIRDIDLTAPVGASDVATGTPKERLFPEMKRPGWLQKLEKMAEETRKSAPRSEDSRKAGRGARK